MNWIDVDVDQPSNECPVIVWGFYKGQPFVTLGIYYREKNWWETIGQFEDFIMIENISGEEQVKVKAWMPLPTIVAYSGGM